MRVQRKEEAQSFLDHYLPQEVVPPIDPGRLEICKDSFIDPELKTYFSDMLYPVRLHGEPGYMYVLFEHKSYEDRLIHLQLLEYMLRIWRLHVKQQTSREPSCHGSCCCCSSMCSVPHIFLAHVSLSPQRRGAR